MGRLGAALAVLAAGWSCTPPATAAEHARLLVSGAASMRDVLAETIAEYEGIGGERIDLNTASSGALLRQILAGAPVDVFVSASPREVARLVEAGLASPAAVRNIAGNRIVVVVPPGASSPASLGDLEDPRFERIALGNPATVPAGRYAREALESASLWDRLADRFVLAENVRQVVEYVSRGDADAGLVYRTDATRFTDRLATGPEAAAGSHPAVVYQAVVLRDSRHPEAAARLVAFLAGERGRAVLARHGFLPPP